MSAQELIAYTDMLQGRVLFCRGFGSVGVDGQRATYTCLSRSFAAPRHSHVNSSEWQFQCQLGGLLQAYRLRCLNAFGQPGWLSSFISKKYASANKRPDLCALMVPICCYRSECPAVADAVGTGLVF